MRTTARSHAAAVVLALAACSSPAFAQADLKGRTVNLYIGSGVGGAIDAVARAFAPHIAVHMPGAPTLAQSNMGGNGGAQAAQYLYNAAIKDGTAIAMVNAGPVSDPLMRGPQLGYDPRRFGWIGSLQRRDHAEVTQPTRRQPWPATHRISQHFATRCCANACGS